MNTQRLATMRFSPLHLQQALFASLALIITLIVVQQFNHWNQPQEVTRVWPSYSHAAPFSPASALQAKDVALSLQPIEDATTADNQAPRQQSWVF